MKTIYVILLILATALYLSKTTISISPFKISLERPYLGLGFILFIIGGILMIQQFYNDGFNKSVEKTTEYIHKKKAN